MFLEMHIKALVELCLQHKASSSDFYLLLGLSGFFKDWDLCNSTAPGSIFVAIEPVCFVLTTQFPKH